MRETYRLLILPGILRLSSSMIWLNLMLLILMSSLELVNMYLRLSLLLRKLLRTAMLMSQTGLCTLTLLNSRLALIIDTLEWLEVWLMMLNYLLKERVYLLKLRGIRKINATLLFGRSLRKMNHSGCHLGVTEDLDGILSAQLWQHLFSRHGQLIFILVESISDSPIMITKLHNQRLTMDVITGLITFGTQATCTLKSVKCQRVRRISSLLKSACKLTPKDNSDTCSFCTVGPTP
mmetsp:Transcript_9163/g.6514  ORF Transcript_9163/g.6514 Transcript_9163/m.6514 type:complete len:235 (+) Transcript_9163:339-1043(+)